MYIDISCKMSFHLLRCFFSNYYKFVSMSPNTDLHLRHGIFAFYPSEIVTEQRADRRLTVPIGAVLCILVMVIYMPYLYKCENYFEFIRIEREREGGGESVHARLHVWMGVRVCVCKCVCTHACM